MVNEYWICLYLNDDQNAIATQAASETGLDTPDFLEKMANNVIPDHLKRIETTLDKHYQKK